MNDKPTWDFDVSVSAQKKKSARKRGMSGVFEESKRECDWQDCKNNATYRAPKSRDQLNDYYWFCLNHIREYNRSWNYFSEMDDEQVEQLRRAGLNWERPTWKLGDKEAMNKAHVEGQVWRRMGIDDVASVLGENATINAGDMTFEARRKLLPKNEVKALEILGAQNLMTKPEIRAQFKNLVKDLHPDMNGGRKGDDELLREVLWAWDQVKSSKSFPDK